MSAGKVIVGLSGGVDSSVAALRLLEQGWAVEGLFMKNWEEDDSEDFCSAAADLADAQAVADLLAIPLHTVNFATEYWDRVFAYFLDEYRAGRTPNPDVLCNREIKFKAFLDYALQLGADRIATGHYAGLRCADSGCQLLRAHDERKDQTYFLYMLGQHALRHSLFPLHDLEKSQVRRLAEKARFPNHKKKDSTGIVRHQGLMYYTRGQRHGLGLGGMTGASDDPWYVVDKDLGRNVLTVAQGHDNPLLYHDRLTARQAHWINDNAPAPQFRCTARCRHRQPLQPCSVAVDDSTLRIRFDQPQRAITPGQSVVLYDGERCLGGAIIEQTP